MRTKLRTALSFTARDWALFIQAWLLLLGIDVALRIFPFHKVLKWLSSKQQNRTSASEEQIEATIRRYGNALARAARHHLYPMTCLRRSLALQWQLSRQGIQTELHIGVRRETKKLEAHAWLEYRGEPIGETTPPGDHFLQLKANGAAR